VPPSKTRNVGWFAFEERGFGPLTLDFGARLEQQKVTPGGADDLPDYDKSSVSASAGGVYKLTDAYALALNLTSTQRHPTATELYANGPHIAADRFEIGDTTLKRERASTVDFGLRKVAGDWRGSIAAFRSDYSRYIFAALTGEFEGDEEELLPIVQYQQADAEFTGFEADLRLPPVEVPVGTLSTRLMADYVRAKLKDGGDLPQIPPLRVGGELNLDRDALSAGLSLMYYDKQDRTGPNELPTDGYTMLNMDVSYRMPVHNRTMLLFLRGENLLDEEARRHTSPLKDVAPLPGRAAAAGVRFEF
jgi:iron complex outermembrane recepter protein